ncbi:hypothetical protein [Pseudorhodoplanes sp.]|uniref:hypothetical protein n=1 Tax=Pseudorhodoplanes sp. TaxID=1934341 RepID=UPI003D096AB7
MEFLRSFDLDLWWNKLVAVGLAILVAALAAANKDLIFIALGMVACGFGEGINHRRDISFTAPSAYLPQHMITQYLRLWHPVGVLLDIGGVILIVLGLYRMLTL